MRCSLLAAAGASPPRWLPFRSPGPAQHPCQARWGCGERRSWVTQGMASAGAAEMAGHLLSSDAAGAAAPSRHLHLPLSSAPRVCTGRCLHGGMEASTGSLSFLFFFLLLLLLHTAGFAACPEQPEQQSNKAKISNLLLFPRRVWCRLSVAVSLPGNGSNCCLPAHPVHHLSSGRACTEQGLSSDSPQGLPRSRQAANPGQSWVSSPGLVLTGSRPGWQPRVMPSGEEPVTAAACQGTTDGETFPPCAG